VSDVSITVNVTVNEKTYVRKLMYMACFKGATSRFARLEKTSLVFQVRHLQSSLIFAILNDPHFVWICSCLLSVFFILEHDHFKVLFYLKATLYDPKNDSKNRDITPKMLLILGLRYRSHYRLYSYKQLYFLEIQMVCFVLLQCEISYSKLTSCKSIDLSQKRK